MAKLKKTPAKPKQKKQLDQINMIIRPGYLGSGRLKDKVAIITGGDSGIGRSVAVLFAREGADVAIAYRSSDKDAKETQQLVEAEQRECLLLKGDLSKETFARKMVKDVYRHFKKLSILVNNAGTHEEDYDFQKISTRQFQHTFDVNMYPFFYSSQEALKVMDKDGCIINTASVVAFRGSEHLIDYSATKGAIVSFTRALAKNLAESGIRVNAVAPGPVWTPLIFASFTKAHVNDFGKKTPMGRAGYPYELAPAFLFLACEDAAYITGQVIHVNGGEIVG
ncbi:SDR family oxidoreductase [Pseudobacter ginsenosidimutans]|uniref:NAD(P)-dependent dehydrogenase (Short-subunit alcohol dehydrogenase family) n=1 Tax=Pseudobacter ginsenosidimutans TaxID=661488 RepID=A0A4Q7MZJ5_9BACT|nr:SDR family oxidoreductase [Pseudobacter ginsenosidimutans]QEC43032.1 SDR family oxidoreductase [Pseudobacter ginsenosidimutans]RZS74383.1 NAD(P)-dependent dehydrogenase (short-subunit alcohol dehydrogenase family) [Pseudobacter ginsenosidimutans]